MRSDMDSCSNPHPLAGGLHVATTSDFCLRRSTHKTERSPAPSTGADVIINDFGHVFGKHQKTGKTRRQHTANLNKALLSGFNGLERQRVPNDDIGKGGYMLVTVLTIRIHDADVLDHSVVINDSIRRT